MAGGCCNLWVSRGVVCVSSDGSCLVAKAYKRGCQEKKLSFGSVPKVFWSRHPAPQGSTTLSIGGWSCSDLRVCFASCLRISGNNPNPPLKPDWERKRPSHAGIQPSRDCRWLGDFPGPIRSRQYRSPENHWWDGDLSQGIDGSAICKHYRVTRNPSRQMLNQHKLPRSGLRARFAGFTSTSRPFTVKVPGVGLPSGITKPLAGRC